MKIFNFILLIGFSIKFAYAKPCHDLQLNQDLSNIEELETIVNIEASQKLHQAIRDCHPSNIKSAIKAGANINTPLNLVSDENISRATPLILAITRDCVSAVEILLENNVDVNQVRATDQNPPLMIAARRGNKDIIEKLIKSPEIEINKTSWSGRTAISAASFNGRTDIVQVLLTREDLDLSASSSFDNSATPIGIAARVNDVETLKLLVNHSDKIKPISKRQLDGAYKKANLNKHLESIELLDYYKKRFYP